MTLTTECKWAIASGIVASLVTSIAFVISMSAVGQTPGMTASLSRVLSKPGFFGFVSGMFAAGNAHSGGSLAVVIPTALAVNALLFAIAAYGIIRVFQMIPHQ